MKFGTYIRAQPDYVPRVIRNLRLEKNHVKTSLRHKHYYIRRTPEHSI